MASLYPYIAANAQAGQEIDLKLHEILWKSVGRGDILILNPYMVDLAGHLSMIVFSGDLRIHLELRDQIEAAQIGPCILRLNSHVDREAVYQVQDDVLTVDADFDGRRSGIRLSRDRKGKMTRCELTGYVGLTAYLQAVT